MRDTSVTHILVVDDDQKIRLLLRRCFEQEGYRVSEAENGLSVRERSLEDVNLITLDLNLGGEDGLEVAREVRGRSNTPIIMVTGKGDMIDKVVGLELGADDYIAKPFHLREVLARVRSVIRRSESHNKSQLSSPRPAQDRYRFEGWGADFSKLELRSPDGSLCDLSTGELQLLEVFVKHANHVLSRDQLMDLLKGHDWAPMDRSLDNQVARLRKKIEADLKNPKLIKTVRGAGYKFVANVERA